jgi:hypothetical protein
MSTARLGSRPAKPAKTTDRAAREDRPGRTSPRGPPPLPSPRAARHPTIAVVEDLVRYARAADLVLADEVLTDILARLHGWPVEELNRLS